MSSADHAVVTVSRNIVTVCSWGMTFTQSVQLRWLRGIRCKETPPLALGFLHFLRVPSKSPHMQNRAVMSMIFRTCSVSLSEGATLTALKIKVMMSTSVRFCDYGMLCGPFRLPLEAYVTSFVVESEVSFPRVIPCFLKSLSDESLKIHFFHYWPGIHVRQWQFQLAICVLFGYMYTSNFTR